MGKVYFGQDGQGRQTAVKSLRPELAHDQQLVQRFLREAQTARSVTGKGVARVLDAQVEGGRPWIAAEFLAGPDLEQAIATHGPLDVPTVHVLASALAHALHEIHGAGIVHRDLKPANIVLTSDGPRIIDFGIARPEHGLTLTTTGQVPITPGYGAPEQVLGHRVGPAADVFSLGAVLVYTAGGQRAFAGSHVAAVQYEVVHGQPQLFHVPEPLRALIAPCLAKEPGMRPTPEEIAHAFVRPRHVEKVWRQGSLAPLIGRYETEAARLVPAGPTVTPMGRGRRGFLTALAGGGAVLALGGGTAAWRLKDD